MPARSIAAVVLVGLVFYGLWKASPLLSGPVLQLESPTNGQTFTDGAVRVSGIALYTEKLSINGAPLLIDKDGAFATTLDMPSGGAILSVTVTDRFGRTHTEQRSVFVPLH